MNLQVEALFFFLLLGESHFNVYWTEFAWKKHIDLQATMILNCYQLSKNRIANQFLQNLNSMVQCSFKCKCFLTNCNIFLSIYHTSSDSRLLTFKSPGPSGRNSQFSFNPFLTFPTVQPNTHVPYLIWLKLTPHSQILMVFLYIVISSQNLPCALSAVARNSVIIRQKILITLILLCTTVTAFCLSLSVERNLVQNTNTNTKTKQTKQQQIIPNLSINITKQNHQKLRKMSEGGLSFYKFII